MASCSCSRSEEFECRFFRTVEKQDRSFTRNMQELSRELNAFGVDHIAIQALKGRQLSIVLSVL